MSQILLNDKTSLYKLIDNFRGSSEDNELDIDIINIINTTDNEFLVRIMYGRLLRILSLHKKKRK